MKARILKILIALDKLAYQIITLGHGAEWDTISSASYRMEQKGRWIGRVARPIIDWMFSKLGEVNHCFSSYQSVKKFKLPEGY